MLPNKEDGLYQMVKDLRYQSINSLLNNMRKVDVFLWIPRFTVEFSISLSKLLQEVRKSSIELFLKRLQFCILYTLMHY